MESPRRRLTEQDVRIATIVGRVIAVVGFILALYIIGVTGYAYEKWRARNLAQEFCNVR
jgi:hypothetical protein